MMRREGAAAIFSPSPHQREERGVRRPIIKLKSPRPGPLPASGEARESAAMCALRFSWLNCQRRRKLRYEE